ncbi:cytochrome ubiquinol oxidase subunit I [Streptomyces sp. NPDC029003]|uniref:cytochrome ubiquinol oxidase subunit I n=1 Tax=Streptomyces sp. NPDC029003 TaxID=3155125 RepID=UPI0033E171ED
MWLGTGAVPVPAALPTVVPRPPRVRLRGHVPARPGRLPPPAGADHRPGDPRDAGARPPPGPARRDRRRHRRRGAARPAALAAGSVPAGGVRRAAWRSTETGRQPWLVYGVLRTADGVSPGVSQGEVLTSMTGFTLLYALLAVIEVKLLVKYVKAGPPEPTDADRNPPTKTGGDDGDPDRPMAFAY